MEVLSLVVEGRIWSSGAETMRLGGFRRLWVAASQIDVRRNALRGWRIDQGLLRGLLAPVHAHDAENDGDDGDDQQEGAHRHANDQYGVPRTR